MRESEEDHSRLDVSGPSKRCHTAGGEQLQLHLPQGWEFLHPVTLSSVLGHLKYVETLSTSLQDKGSQRAAFPLPSSVSVSNVNANLPKIEASKFPKTLFDEWSSPLPFLSLSKSLRKK